MSYEIDRLPVLVVPLHPSESIFFSSNTTFVGRSMEKGELSPSDCFPNEIWELIFVWLDRVGLESLSLLSRFLPQLMKTYFKRSTQKSLGRLTLTCTTFKHIIDGSQKLHYTLHMLWFDTEHSRQISLLSGGDNRHAALSRRLRSEYGYPGWKNQVAFVADAGQVPRFVHFLVTSPGKYTRYS